MPQPLSGPGLGLGLPQNLYPSNLTNGEVNLSTNTITLAPGQALPIAAGRWIIGVGKYASLQYLDPVTNQWTLLRDSDNSDGTYNIWSDGFNVRVANLTGCVVGGVVTNGGTGYVAGTTTITPSTGNSVWAPIIGGALSTTVTVNTAGSGYGIAPLVFIDAPPAPGIQATAIAVISSGSVTSITVVDQGAGYTSVPNITILPNPADPNIGTSITNAAATATLTGAGTVTGALLLNSGAPVASTMSLTVVGAGTSAAVTPLFLQTITAASVTAGGGGYGTAPELTTLGGYNTTTGALANPTQQLQGFAPRAANITLAVSGGVPTSVTKIVDGGLFLSTPTPLVLSNAVITTAATVTVTLGSNNTVVSVNPLA